MITPDAILGFSHLIEKIKMWWNGQRVFPHQSFIPPTAFYDKNLDQYSFTHKDITGVFPREFVLFCQSNNQNPFKTFQETVDEILLTAEVEVDDDES